MLQARLRLTLRPPPSEEPPRTRQTKRICKKKCAAEDQTWVASAELGRLMLSTRESRAEMGLWGGGSSTVFGAGSWALAFRAHRVLGCLGVWGVRVGVR